MRKLSVSRLQKLVLVAMVLLVFGACTKTSSAKPITINWWVGSWKYEDGRAAKVVEDFEKANPGIKVQITPITWEGMQEKMLSALMSKTGPDIMCISNAWGTSYAATGGLADVGDALDRIGREKFFDGTIEWTQYNGVDYGLPYRTEAKLLFYNKAMLKNAGFDIPPRTLEELAIYAKRLTSPNVSGLAVPLKTDDANAATYFRYLCRAFGGDFVSPDEKTSTLNSPAIKKAATFYSDLYKSGALPSDCMAMTNNEARIQFANGHAAMTIEGPWGISTCEETGIDFGLAVLPGLEGPDGSWDSAGWSLVITSFSKNIEAAKKFAEFFLKPENDAYLTDALPAIRESTKAQRFNNNNIQVFFKQLENMHPALVTSAGPALYTSVTIGLQRIFEGQNIDKVLSEVRAEDQKLLDNAK